MAVVFSVTSDNWLDVEMSAQELQPHVDMQFIAVGFSRDSHMVPKVHDWSLCVFQFFFQGDDAVTECVLSNNPGVGASEPQVYLSYNKPEKFNTRLDLSDVSQCWSSA